MTQLYADLFAAVAGSIVSILIDMIPKLNEWYAGLSTTAKRGVMAVLMLLVAAGVYALSCAGILAQIDPNLKLTCNAEGIFLLVRAFLVALGANQGTYWAKPKQVSEK